MHPLGTVLQDRYRIEAILGQGGMGNVYLARHLDLDRMVAIKEMTPGNLKPSLQEAALRQFHQEALILHRLNHPRLPRVLDFFEVERTPYLVMDYIKGRTLQSVVDAEDDPLPERLVRHWASELCEVLDYLHTFDPVVVFRDLKPGNVMLDADGDIKLIDFGISKMFDGTTKSKTNTFARGCISPGFTPPEQYAGRSDTKSDIYSLGASLYYLMTRTTPADAVQRAADLHALVPVQELRSDISKVFADGIECLMTINAEGRPATIEECRQVLGLDGETFIGSVPTALSDWTPAPAVAPPPVPAQPRRIGLVLATVALLAAAAGVAVWWPELRGPPPPASLTVTSHPDGAAITLNQEPVGTTPLTLASMSPGAYEVQLDKLGFESARQRIELSPSDHKTMDVPLGTLQVRVPLLVDPPDSVLVVDGTLRGLLRSDASIELSPGTHHLELSRAGYKAEDMDVEIEETGPPAPIHVALLSMQAATPSPAETLNGPWALTCPHPSSTAAFNNTDPAIGDGLIVPGQRVGPFAIASPVQTVSDMHHLEVSAPDGSLLLSYLEGTLWLVVRQQQIQAVFVRNDRFLTPEGTGAGTSQDDVQQKYGGGQVEHQGTRDWTTFSDLGLAFAFHDGRVSYVLVGRPGDDLPLGFLEASQRVPLTAVPGMILDTGQ